MPARRRRQPGGAQPDLATRTGRRTAQQQAAKEYADRLKAERDEQSRRDRERNEARRREQLHGELVEAKDRAAQRVKDVRRRGLPGAARVEAEEAYRAALDALLRHEQGLPPVDEEETPPDAAEDPGPTDPAAEDSGLAG